MRDNSEQTPLFSIDSQQANGAARTGFLDLPHGRVETPVFMPVGTGATVKAVTQDDVADMGFRLILANTYHLYLRPGVDVVSRFGGLHRFSAWPHNILTDSGGFQVFSLAANRKISEEGVRFRSHIDGSSHDFTPESVVELQAAYGSDIQMALDICTPYGIDHAAALKACDMTARWAKRAITRRAVLSQTGESFASYKGELFPIVQGNFFTDLRERSVEQLLELEPRGIALGGLSVGEPYPVFADMLSHTAALIPPELPRYVMGIGTPEYIVAAVEQGIDMFDCVFPTRAGRNGSVFTKHGRIALKNAQFRYDEDPIDTDCDCFTCSRYSRAYLRHLFIAGEMLGPMLATRHNLRFLSKLLEDIRTAIRSDTFPALAMEVRTAYPPQSNVIDTSENTENKV